MLNELKNSKITTYDRDDFYANWNEVNENLGERWDAVIEFNPHHNIGKTLTDKYWVSAILKLLDQWMPKKKGLKILKFDLYNEATGTSAVTEWFIKRGYEVWGVDISKEVTKRAKKNFKDRIPPRQFVIGDIRDLPFKDNTFDIVFSFGTIEHIRENAISVNEAYRVLKPGGLFITGINNKIDMWGSYFVNEMTNRLYKHITSYEPSFFPWQQREWLNQAGFENIHTTGMILLPHILRYGDLFVEWKVKNRIVKGLWNTIIMRPAIFVARILDDIDPLRVFAMHTTSYGYKPDYSKKKKRKS